MRRRQKKKKSRSAAETGTRTHRRPIQSSLDHGCRILDAKRAFFNARRTCEHAKRISDVPTITDTVSHATHHCHAKNRQPSRLPFTFPRFAFPGRARARAHTHSTYTLAYQNGGAKLARSTTFARSDPNGCELAKCDANASRNA